MSIKRIYIAGPYTSDDPWEAEQFVREAERWGYMVAKRGACPVIPHANTRHYFRGIQTPEWWYEATLAELRTCDAILLFPWWQESKGSVAEKAEAERLGLKIFDSEKAGMRIKDMVEEWIND
jgi:hypothetical protein